MRACKHGYDILDLRIFLRIIFIKPAEHFFHVYMASSNARETGRIFESYDYMYVLGLHNCLEFSQPSSCLDEAVQTW